MAKSNHVTTVINIRQPLPPGEDMALWSRLAVARDSLIKIVDGDAKSLDDARRIANEALYDIDDVD